MEKRVDETVTGTVEEIIFRREENGFTVMELDVDGDPLTVVGVMPNVGEGEELEVRGYYTTHPTFGRQFRAVLYTQRLPATAHAIEKYLSSGSIKGIGPALARRIVDRFGEKTLEVIEKEPQRLIEVRGISANLANVISEEFMRVYGLRTVMTALKDFGLTPAESVFVYKLLGTSTLEIIRQNPYILCAPHIGLDFDRVDDIGYSLGFDYKNHLRLKAGCVYVLNHNFLKNGHACLPYMQMLKICTDFLSAPEGDTEIAMHSCISDGSLVYTLMGKLSNGYLYLPKVYHAEKYVAKRIADILKMSRLRGEKDWEKDIKKLERQSGIEYESLQREAISRALNDGFLVLSGGPGTGKTTTLNAIITLYKNQGLNVAIAAPTGRAAKRISEVTGYDAKTIHRLLEVQFDRDDTTYFVHNESNPLKADVLIIDEFSMVDLMLFESLLRALKPTARLILVGDANQLPSVACGNVLGDLMKCEQLPIIELKQIFRQAAQSLIVTNAHKIVSGEMPDLTVRDRDFFFLKEFDQRKAAKTVLSLVCERLPKSYGFSPAADIQVLCPGKMGELGTYMFNQLLQERLNPPAEDKAEFTFGNVTFRVGDKIMQNRNDYDVVWTREGGEKGTGIFNGDIGEIISIDRRIAMMKIRFDDRIAEFAFDLLNEIDHAYAVTVHKSQGSEFEAVVLPLMGRHRNLHYRKLLYTAVTRAKKLLIVVGEEATVREMVENHKKNLRYSNLLKFLNYETLGGDEGVVHDNSIDG